MESTWSSKYLKEHGKCGVYKDIIIPPRACELWRAQGHYNISKSMGIVECTWTLKYLQEHGSYGEHMVIIKSQRASEVWSVHGHYNISKSMGVMESTGSS